MKDYFIIYWFVLAVTIISCTDTEEPITMAPERPIKQPGEYIYVQGKNLLLPDQSKFFIKGTNLAGWLSPEGHLFDLPNVQTEWQLSELFCQYAGPAKTANFWKKFKDNYITRADIEFIAQCGANTIRVPFNYKLFTDEDFMGITHTQDGFERLDNLFTWCNEFNLYVILNMQAAPGGQTGAYTDNGFGYPWLFESRAKQSEFIKIWVAIADRYKTEKNLLGYELINAPINESGFDQNYFNPLIEPLYKKTTMAIRKVDTNHIIILGGAQNNTNFEYFMDFEFDDNIMYSCHLYDDSTLELSIDNYLNFRDQRTGLPMYMSEIGLQSDSWRNTLSKAMIDNNVGYTFYPYKKINDQCFISFNPGSNWNRLKSFANADRSTFDAIHLIKRDIANAIPVLDDFVEACKFENCTKQVSYINSTQMK